MGIDQTWEIVDWFNPEKKPKQLPQMREPIKIKEDGKLDEDSPIFKVKQKLMEKG